MQSLCNQEFEFIDQPSYLQTTMKRSFLDQIDVVELTFEDIECLASFEPSGSVYHRLLDELRARSLTSTSVSVLTNN